MSVAAADPYRYLEDSADPRTVARTTEQNARTRAALDAVPGRATLAARLDALLRTDVVSVPVAGGERTFFTARRGTANQAALYVREGEAVRTLVDPARLDSDGLTAIDWWHASQSGNVVAFGLSRNGDERSTLHVVDAASGSLQAEANSGHALRERRLEPGRYGVLLHAFSCGRPVRCARLPPRLGAPHANDELVFGIGRKPEDMLQLDRSPDGRWLVVNALDGWSRSDAYVADTTAPVLCFVPLAQGRAGRYDVHVTDRALYVRTDEDAPRFRVFRVDPQAPERAAWIEVVPQAAGTLEALTVAGDTLVLHYLEDVRSVLRVRRPDGEVETIAGLRGRSVLAMTGDAASGDAYVQLASYVEAPEIVRVQLRARPATLQSWDRIATPFDASAYRVEQRWFVSKDGTRVPMSIVARRDVAWDGTAPAVLYGYGGFNISLVPAFAASLVPWLDAGGVYAVANLRGGGEFGEAWHQAGMRERKQNVFDDFVAAAEYLGSSGIADPARLAVMGGSNGGLLVAAFATQRPELARAIVCLVPLTDMLRYHEFLIARLWIAEYGDPDDAADAAVLRAYSPYHNVRDGAAYPAMLVATAESDGRVDPMHARKFGARVQAATSGDARVYVYVEPNAGHGVGKPRHKMVAELADRWCFVATALDVAL